MKGRLRFSAALLCLLLFVSLWAPAALAAVPLEGEDLSGQVIILHTNDSHGHVDDNMGFAAVAALKKQYEAAGAEVLTLDAGDTFHGMPFATLKRGEDVIPLLEGVGYDAMTCGNHDFNYGPDRLLELAGISSIPLLAANVRWKDGGEALFEPSLIVEKGGVRFGIFGLTTPDTAYQASPLYVENLDFEDPVAAAEEQVAALREEDVDYIIALAHLGVDRMSTLTSDQLAARVEGIDLIIDGHSHTAMAGGAPLDTALALEPHGDTLIASTGAYIEAVGVIALGAEGGFDASLVTAEDFEARDEGLTSAINEIKSYQQPILEEVVGETPVRLEGEREQVRTGETNLGNLIADAFLDATGADVALMNGGSIRGSIEAGDITQEDIITVFPFGNYVLTQQVTGADLLAAMEHAVADWPEPSPTFPQVGGMSFTLDASAPAGSRVVDLRVGGEALDEGASYVIALDDYLAGGGDDFEMFKGLPQLQFYGALEDMMVDYIAGEPPIGAEAEGRVTIAHSEGMSASEVVDALEEDPGSAEEGGPAGDAPSSAEVAASAYTVVGGDCLWAIAERQLGDGMRWAEIWRANSGQIADPNLIYPGQVLQLPAA